MRPNRGQIEIMGLVLIVVIITIVFLFGITFKVKSKTTPSAFANDQLATNFLLALLKTDHVECDTTLSNLIYDCAGDHKIKCADSSGTEHDSCYYVNDSLNQILPESLGANRLNSKYKLKLVKIPTPGTEEELFTFEDSCGPKQPKGMQGYQPISLYPKYPRGRVDVTLDICK